jgi:hypothetical protein
MIKLIQKHPVLSACAVLAAACLVAMLFFGELTIYAWPLLGVVGFIATVVLSYQVFGAAPNSSIYGPGTNSDDDRR